jgi:hypothetical protein
VRRTITLILVTAILLQTVDALADCADLSPTTRYTVLNVRSILFYAGDDKIAIIELWPDEIVLPTSKISIIENIVCDLIGTISIDNRKVRIYKVKKLGPGEK